MSDEIRLSKGALMFDGCIFGSTQNVGSVTSYCAQSYGGTEVRYQLSCIQVSPFGQVEDQGEDIDQYNFEATLLDEGTHLEFFTKVFELCGLSFYGFVVCKISDEATIKMRLALISCKSCIDCYSHKLSLQSNAMIQNDVGLSESIDSVLTQWNFSEVKNATVIRNMTDNRPVLANETRRSGCFRMHSRFLLF